MQRNYSRRSSLVSTVLFTQPADTTDAYVNQLNDILTELSYKAKLRRFRLGDVCQTILHALARVILEQCSHPDQPH